MITDSAIPSRLLWTRPWRTRKGELKDINIRHCLSLTPKPVSKPTLRERSSRFRTGISQVTARKLHDRGRCYLPPHDLPQPAPVLPEEHQNRRRCHDQGDQDEQGRIFQPPHGQCGSARGHGRFEEDHPRSQPATFPGQWAARDEVVHISEVDYVVEFESKVEVIPPAAPTEIDKKIAAHIVPMIPNGACIQLGIGGLPNFVGSHAGRIGSQGPGLPHGDARRCILPHVHGRQADQQEEGHRQEQERLRLCRRQPVPL